MSPERETTLSGNVQWPKVRRRPYQANPAAGQKAEVDSLRASAYVLFMRVKSSLSFLAASSMLFAGCADFTSRVRQHTYPPDFRYISREQLQSTMGQLAFHSRELDRLIRSPENPLTNRTEILEHLWAMERAAAQLDRSGWPTNHPLIDMNLSSFRRDIRLASEAAQRDPPNFMLARSLAGACVYCHGGR